MVLLRGRRRIQSLNKCNECTLIYLSFFTKGVKQHKRNLSRYVMVSPHEEQTPEPHLPHAERLMQLQQMGQLRPLLFNTCVLSMRQRNELIEFLIILRSGLNYNEESAALDFIISYANDHLVCPNFNDIACNEYILVVRNWIDLSTWNNVPSSQIAAILRHYRDPILTSRLNDAERRLNEIYNFVIV